MTPLQALTVADLDRLIHDLTVALQAECTGHAEGSLRAELLIGRLGVLKQERADLVYETDRRTQEGPR